MINFNEIQSDLKAKIRERRFKTDDSDATEGFVTTKDILSKTAKYLSNQKDVFSDDQAAFEDFSEPSPKMSGSINFSEVSAQDDLIDFVESILPSNEFGLEHGTGSRMQVSETMSASIARIMSGGVKGIAEHVAYGRDDANFGTLGTLYGADAWADVYMDGQRSAAAIESFGPGMDMIQSDIRLNVGLSAMKAFKSLPDRVTARVADETNIVKVKIWEYEVYDLSKSRAATADERYGSHKHPLIDMFRNPDPLDTTPKKVEFKAAGDADIVADGFVVMDKTVNVFDKTFDSNAIGFDHKSYTDILSEGATIKNVLVQIHSDESTDITESFIIPIGDILRGARFVQQANTASTERTATVKAKNVFTVRKTTQTSAATVQTLVKAAVEDTFAVRISLDLTGTLDIQKGDLHYSGSATMAVEDDEGNAPVAANTGATALATNLAKATSSITITGVESEIFFSESNVRKTTTAVRDTSRTLQFEIPVGKTVAVDIAMDQSEPTQVLDVISTVNDIGNTARALKIYESTLRTVATRVDYEKTGNVSAKDSLQNQYPAGSMAIPYVISTTVDFTKSDLELMRESEIASDVAALMKRSLLGIVSELLSKSLYHRSLAAGERPVFKLIAHNEVVNTVFAIPQYHEVFNSSPEGGRMQRNASYSIQLDNGTRIDVYGVDFDDWRKKAIMFPIRDADPAAITSFATTRDRGTYVGSYTNSEGGAAHRRFIVNSREIPFIQNPVGAVIQLDALNTIYKNLPA